jgi:hypothetical protein
MTTALFFAEHRDFIPLIVSVEQASYFPCPIKIQQLVGSACLGWIFVRVELEVN